MTFINPNPRYVVDGHEFENADSNLMGDGTFPPFLIFNTDAQDHLPQTYQTRGAAEAALLKLNTFQVWGNYGAMEVSCATGEVLAYTPDLDYDPAKPDEGYADILCFDLASFDGPVKDATHWDHVDVLDLGFWTKTGEYVERARDWEVEEPVPEKSTYASDTRRGELSDDLGESPDF